MIGKIATIASISTAVLALAAGTATAEPATAMSTAAPNAVAPGCITVSHYNHFLHTTFYAHNTCGSPYRVQLVIDNGYDSDCFSLQPGHNHSYDSTSDDGGQPSLNHVNLC